MSDDHHLLNVPTPGAYMKACRLAEGLDLAEVAAQLRTDPPVPELERVEWLKLIEGHVMPASWSTLVALSTVFYFDLNVLAQLDLVAQGRLSPGEAPKICALCGSERGKPPRLITTLTGQHACPACTNVVPIGAAA